ncbi:MAG: hypothetical protein ACJAUP_000805 [Cellvibrionaceae bacterium]|jgi:hypothetical protein
MLEASSQWPAAVTDHAATPEQAVDEAAQKLAHRLGSTLGRQQDQRKKTPYLPLSETKPEEF